MIRELNQRGLNCVTSTPLVDLLLAEIFNGLDLVLALQGT